MLSFFVEKIAAEENAQKGNTSITTASSASSCSRADSSDDEFDYYDRKKTREFLMKTYREALQGSFCLFFEFYVLIILLINSLKER